MNERKKHKMQNQIAMKKKPPPSKTIQTKKNFEKPKIKNRKKRST
ncbi:hypothetical protein HMPREF1378_00717 [Enterococcus faecium R496]|uniref:Uncharacterized protein n=3 Tax=Enterococcus faecium TaxID=1352 RepID=A0A3G1TV40_ENTFC|nr:hypothetical protein [Enterococcus faecium]EFR67480.1 hypothetical protein HMPREF9524_02372 [Enterococcus faecium TX0133a01]EFR71912.1 hypothetical protein HMPREF9526_01054 [Enterococcus faecium TX0133B]EFR74156.1 hypothetical protein HMPREF9523_01938 [Enterococcus faecium TX0133A]EFR77363.1 hypothetical protein HMPREF9527_01826 [Enterococcus faecium TX0133C]EFS07842.1 hypothetical protein HMPREF9525_00042 [Enterococcus faecium TX0133a04]EJX54527.1 hypothetical protein HMPREF1378_00717 [En